STRLGTEDGVDPLIGFADKCARLGVSCDVQRGNAPLPPEPEEGDLHVLDRNTSASDIATAAATLRCAVPWQPRARLLILEEGRPLSSAFLQAAVRLSRGWSSEPVVLTVARTERAALRQQQRLQALAPDLAAEFDSYVGPDVPGGVARIARWRH